MAPYLLTQARLLQSHRQLNGHLAGNLDVFGRKGSWSISPQVYSANELTPAEQGHADVGTHALGLHVFNHRRR